VTSSWRTFCGCQLFGHLTRPAHTHGSAHRTVCDVHEQVAGLLGHPPSDWMRCHPQQVIHDGGKQFVRWRSRAVPRHLGGQTDKTPAGGRYVVGALRPTSRTCWCTPPRTGRCPRSRPAVLPVASRRKNATTRNAQPGYIEVIRAGQRVYEQADQPLRNVHTWPRGQSTVVEDLEGAF
jgi:hypothetical protein